MWLPQPEEVPLLPQEQLEGRWVPHVTEPLEERLPAQSPSLRPPTPLEKEPQLEEPRPLLPEPLEEVASELRRELRVAQPRSTVQRVRESLLTDPVLPPPPPRQRPLQQPEEPMEKLIEAWLEEHA